MDTTTGNHVAPEQKFVTPREVGNRAARFANEQHPGGHIPRVEVIFVKGVEPPGRYVG